MAKNKCKRSKFSRKFYMAALLVAALFICALMGNAFTSEQRVVLLISAALVGCVWIVAEAKVDKAAAPLNLPDDLVPEKKKPPEAEAE